MAGVGFQGFRDQYALFSYDESDFNNWRGAQGALYNWGMGGTKLMLMRNTTVQDHYPYGNQAQGLWFDTDNKNITVNNATVAGSIMSACNSRRTKARLPSRTVTCARASLERPCSNKRSLR